ncbi:MAG: helix-turn-helix domain-containing protein [Kiritimatiellae bacterium]|nr:helix-turn-helix domain-containing protein [Kiritimatiellia bacterium]
MIQMGAAPGNYCGPVRPTVYKSEVKAKALGMLRDGVPKMDVARRLGISYSTVKDWCRREGVNGAEAEPDRLHEFPAWVKCRMAALGWTQQELSRRSGVCATTICNILVGRYGASLSVAVKIIDALEDACPSR